MNNWSGAGHRQLEKRPYSVPTSRPSALQRTTSHRHSAVDVACFSCVPTQWRVDVGSRHNQHARVGERETRYKQTDRLIGYRHTANVDNTRFDASCLPVTASHSCDATDLALGCACLSVCPCNQRPSVLKSSSSSSSYSFIYDVTERMP